MKIEQAIEILECVYPSQKEIVTGEYPDVAEALDFAISALQEKAEREKGCEYCDTMRPRFNVCSPAELQMSGPLNSKYCRMCGRRLEDNNRKESNL